MDDLTNVSPGIFNLTLDSGILQYGGPTAAPAASFALANSGDTLEVLNAATTLTLTGAITGTLFTQLTKAGPGTLTVTNPSNSFGSLTVSAGRLDVPVDAALGQGPVAVGPFGTVRYTATATTARTFTLNSGALEAAAGVTLTLNGAAVGGGFLRGAGVFAVNGGTAVSGASTANSTTVNVTGPATFTNFSNSGALTLAPGLPSPPSFNNTISQGSGSITVGAVSKVNATDFQSYGTLTLNPAAVGGGQFTELINTGTSPMFFNGGSRTFVGTPATANSGGNPTFVAGVDLNGQNAVVAGGLFVNNGFVVDSSNGGAGTATIIADFGALVKGAGFFQNPVITQNGGRVQAGNSPDVASFGRFVFGPGGVNNYIFAIDDATGIAGPSPDALGHVSGWGLVKTLRQSVGSLTSSGDFTWTATPTGRLTVAIDTLVNPTTVGTDVPGWMANFNPSHSYSWPAARWAGSYSGPIDAATLNAATSFDTSAFLNPVNGAFGWSLDAAGETLSLVYTPSAVPEPGTLTLVALGAFGLVRRRRAR
jgi:autotransporter-associated beta strand protein